MIENQHKSNTITKLVELNYLPIEDQPENIRLIFADRIKQIPNLPTNITSYVKLIQQRVEYTLSNGQLQLNPVSLAICVFVNNGTFDAIDVFSFVPFPFMFKTNVERDVFNNLYNVYLSDLKQIIQTDELDYGEGVSA